MELTWWCSKWWSFQGHTPRHHPAHPKCSWWPNGLPVGVVPHSWDNEVIQQLNSLVTSHVSGKQPLGLTWSCSIWCHPPPWLMVASQFLLIAPACAHIKHKHIGTWIIIIIIIILIITIIINIIIRIYRGNVVSGKPNAIQKLPFGDGCRHTNNDFGDGDLGLVHLYSHFQCI